MDAAAAVERGHKLQEGERKRSKARQNADRAGIGDEREQQRARGREDSNVNIVLWPPMIKGSSQRARCSTAGVRRRDRV